MNEEFMLALDHLAEEKKISKEHILEAVEAALAAAYRKDYGESSQIIRCKIDPEAGSTKFWQVKKIVEEVMDENSEISLEDAKKEKKDAELEGEIEYSLKTKDEFGRIAAQTAKQVVIQKIKELEREIIFNEFKTQEGRMVNGVVQQVEAGNVIVDLGRANGIMFPAEQIPGENYRTGQRIKVVITSVETNNRGPQIIISRAHPDLIRYLFMVEVPEIESGTVEIMGIAREAGVRTKMSVRALQDGVDPVGSCVGQRGTRVQAVLSEVGDEKIDIVLWDEGEEGYIINSLSPAKIADISLNQKHREAIVYVDDDQLSLAIGKNGQNVRLAAKLTDWKIDVLAISEKPKSKKKADKEKEEDGDKESVDKESTDKEEKTTKKKESKSDFSSLPKSTLDKLAKGGIKSIDDLKDKTQEDLESIEGIGAKTAEKILDLLG